MFRIEGVNHSYGNTNFGREKGRKKERKEKEEKKEVIKVVYKNIKIGRLLCVNLITFILPVDLG